MPPVLVYTLATLGGIGFILGASLAYASKKFAVEVDPKVEAIIEVLPGANCGGCGFAGCSAYAEAVVLHGANATLCAPGGHEVKIQIAEILGIEASASDRKVAYLHCAGSRDVAKDKYVYDGVKDCEMAAMVAGGPKSCEYGCIGFGNCVDACQFDALYMGDDGLPVVRREKCTGCGACVRACPKGLFELLPDSVRIYLACSSHDRGKGVKEACSVGCIGCGICAKVSESDAISMKDNLPSIDYESEINLVVAHFKCPTKSYKDLAPKRPHMTIDINKCTGHGKCAEVCPVKNCITGEAGTVHTINPKLCIGCGRCMDVCPEKAIRVVGAMGYIGHDESS